MCFKFELGDYVSCKKWNGEKILGIYVYQGRDGSHFILAENNRRWNIKPNDIKLANVEETKYIKKKVENKTDNFKTAMQNLLKKNPMAKLINIKQKEEELLEIVTTPIE